MKHLPTIGTATYVLIYSSSQLVFGNMAGASGAILGGAIGVGIVFLLTETFSDL